VCAQRAPRTSLGVGSGGALGVTFLGGMIIRAAISGRMNKVTNHPQASNLSEISCQKATNVNTAKVLMISRLLPPRGMYIYRIVQRLKLLCQARQNAMAE
jgi:hypothetical protein